MKVFVFDLLAYDANLDHLKNGGPELPSTRWRRSISTPTPRCGPMRSISTPGSFLDKCGYDGVRVQSSITARPTGLMNSPNLMASAAAAQRTKNLEAPDLYGNLLPLHEACCASRRGIGDDRLPVEGAPRFRGLPAASRANTRCTTSRSPRSRARFDEAFDIITRAWEEEGTCSLATRASSGRTTTSRCGPRPGTAPASADLGAGDRQQGIDRVRRQASICRSRRASAVARGLRDDDIIRYYAKCLLGRRASDHAGPICRSALPPTIADSTGPRRSRNTRHAHPLFQPDPLQPRQLRPRPSASARRVIRPDGLDRLRAPGKPARRGEPALRIPQRDDARPSRSRRSRCRLAPPTQVAQRIIDAADSAGANQVQLAMNRGALPHDLFMAQIERFAKEVLPILQAHEVKTVPAAEEAMALEAYAAEGFRAQRRCRADCARGRRCAGRDRQTHRVSR